MSSLAALDLPPFSVCVCTRDDVGCLGFVFSLLVLRSSLILFKRVGASELGSGAVSDGRAHRWQLVCGPPWPQRLVWKFGS